MGAPNEYSRCPFFAIIRDVVLWTWSDCYLKGKSMKSWIFALSLLMLVLILGVSIVSSQGDCPAIVQQALDALGENCSDITRNSACYGYNQVSASFSETQSPDFFTKPADKAALRQLTTLRTAPLNTETGEWGVAVMSVVANLPNTLPGQAVTFLLMGETSIENAVLPEEAFEPAEGVAVTTNAAANLQISPSANSDSLANIPANTEVLVDGFSADGLWLRAVFNEQVGWVLAENVSGETSDLPALSSVNRTPMQAFFFTTGVGQAECQEAESAVAVQSPENLKVDLTVNGVDIRVGSMVTFKTLGPNRFLLTVHDGEVETVDGQIIPAGNSIEAELDVQGRVINWSEVRPATEEELQLGDRADTAYLNLGLPGDEGEENAQNGGVDENGQTIHIVASGETLFSIARLYNTSMQGIIDTNGIVNPAILFVGQRLVIPNPGSGFVGLPDTTPNTTTQVDQPLVPSTGVDCAAFRLTSPVGGSVPGDAAPYYWDAAPGATSYQVNIYNSSGGLAGSLFTGGPETTIVVDTRPLGVGGSMQWEVIALLNGQPVCSTGRSPQQVQQAAPPPPSPVAIPLAASAVCGGSTSEVDVSWSNALPGETITISFSTIGPTVNYNQVVSGPSGSFLFTAVFGSISMITVQGTQSGTVILPPPGGGFC